MKKTKPLKVRKRFFKVAFIFFKIFLDFNRESKLRVRKGFQKAQKIMEKTHRKRAKQLYDVAVELGGVLIKLCQYLSTRRDLFPDPYIEILASLQDNVPSIPYETVERILRNQYGTQNWPFQAVDPVPLASASLGQTHKAQLKTGETVVIKVLKPEIESIIDIDFSIFYHVFKIMSHFRQFRENADFGNVMEEFIRVTGDELNFKREVLISKRFKTGLSHLSYIHVPYVYEEFSADKIIVMEFISGNKITDFEGWKDRNNDPVVLARRIVEMYVYQFLRMKLIHFDPHPGNILVMDNNRIGLLDFGMSGEITDRMSNGIREGFTAFSRKDYTALLKVIDDLGFFRKNVNIHQFLPVLEYFFNEVMDTIDLEKNSQFSVDLSPVVDDLVEIIYSQPFRLPYEWAYIGRTVGTLTGLISFLYPQFKLYQELKPYVDQFLSENIQEIGARVLDTVKTNLTEILSLPGRANSFITRIEKGTLKFEVDMDELDRKFNILQTAFVKGISLLVGMVSAGIAYYSYVSSHLTGAGVFGAVSGILTLIMIFYRKTSPKDKIRQVIRMQSRMASRKD
jgi:predicted unusual protein kinase regulating ubiquinone biosynthesis (AarF/ABC1/UbiB family)